MMKISTGHWVDGDMFYGRNRELEIMADILADKRASILIPGPRRIGKTSLVKEFIRRNKDRYHIVYFDLESRKSIVELTKDIVSRLEKEHPSLIKKKISVAGAWNTLAAMLPELKISGLFSIKTGVLLPEAKALLDRMEEVFEILNQHDFIFAFDEFSDFLLELKKNSDDEVHFFLEWLRRMRQEGKIRLIISGSINIVSTVEELNVADLINDLTDQDVFPLTDTEIRELINKLIKSIDIQLTDDAIEYAAKQLDDGIPFFIQLFASGLRSFKEPGKTSYNAGDIEKIYHKITGKQHKEFIDLHARLNDYLEKNEYQAAIKILAHLSSDPMTFEDLFPYIQDILPAKDRFQKLLKRLMDECYLVKEKSQYRFVSNMLADWWQNTYDWEK